MHIPEQCHAGVPLWKRNSRSCASMALRSICAKKAGENNAWQNYPLHMGFLESCHDPIKKPPRIRQLPVRYNMVY